MRSDRIICLANSYKHDHRCVAGISLDTKKWVRLIGKQVPGCLTRNEASYRDGKEVALLDVFEAELDKECGSNCHPEDVNLHDFPVMYTSSNCHPEDVYITGKSWRFVRSYDEISDSQLLAACINNEPVVLEGYRDRIEICRFEAKPARCSLGLNIPGDLFWWIREEKGKRKNRALFRLGRIGRIRYGRVEDWRGV